MLTTSNIKNSGLPFAQLRATPTVRIILFIALTTLCYLILASTVKIVFPEDTSQSSSALLPYLKYAWKNSSLLLFAAGLWKIWMIARDSGSDPIFSHLSKNRKILTQDIVRLASLFFVGMVTFAVFMYSFSTIKTRITAITPFYTDVFFMELDKALFFGHHPWEVFEWIYSFPLVIAVFDFIYDVWALLLVSVFLLSYLNKNQNLVDRFRFPIALIITWFIGGNITATLLSSAGPCYFSELTGLSSIYAGQFEYLDSINLQYELRALTYQKILWDTHISGSFGLGGISAMPSMHCASAFLFVLMARKHKFLRLATALFFIIIFISSFLLGWHYAVDGLLAIPIALFGWWSAKHISQRLVKSS